MPPLSTLGSPGTESAAERQDDDLTDWIGNTEGNQKSLKHNRLIFPSESERQGRVSNPPLQLIGSGHQAQEFGGLGFEESWVLPGLHIEAENGFGVGLAQVEPPGGKFQAEAVGAVEPDGFGPIARFDALEGRIGVRAVCG